MDKWKENCKLNHLCINCGCALEEGATTLKCIQCRKKDSIRSTIFTTERRKNKDLCSLCGIVCKNKICDFCLERARDRKKLRYYKYKEAGLCPECGDIRVGNIDRCEKHCLSDLCKNALKTTKYVKELKQMFLDQEGKCYYSGRKIEIGVNASLDHKIPVSSNHPDVYTLKNLVWSDIRINKMKNAIIEEDFLSICQDVTNTRKIPKLLGEDVTIVSPLKQELNSLLII